ncbi:MAG: ATP-binding protein [Proteobacteria bacterium]|nr:ATP-binding protein [Pseudomonadota bacterium]
MIQRDILQELKSVALEYPVVTIVGPRQSGKTTLAGMVFKKKPYCSLEDPDTALLAATDPRGFLGQFPDGAVLDEIQRAPQLLSYLQTIVDRQPKRKGLFILTGSHQPQLHSGISQSLAGRTALLTLMPLSIAELRLFKIKPHAFQCMLSGFYPRIYNDGLDPSRFYKNYFATYVERDVRQILNLKDLSAFQKFMRLLAGRIGQLINFSSLANDTGVSSVTIKHWCSILKASYIIYELRPYYRNFNKRLVKSPKIYFTDVGLAAYLLGLTSPDQIRRDPCRGGLFENLVIMDIYKSLVNTGQEPDLYFFRDTNGNEVDLLFARGRELIPVEIKSSETYSPDFVRGIEYFKKTAGQDLKGFVVYAGDRGQRIGSNKLCGFAEASRAVLK